MELHEQLEALRKKWIGRVIYFFGCYKRVGYYTIIDIERNSLYSDGYAAVVDKSYNEIAINTKKFTISYLNDSQLAKNFGLKVLP